MPKQDYLSTEKRLQELRAILSAAKKTPLTAITIQERLESRGYEIGLKQVQLDLKNICENEPSVGLVRQKNGRKYEYLVPVGSLPKKTQEISASEAVALKVLEQQAKRCFPESVWEALTPYFDIAQKMLDKLELNQKKHLAKKVVDVPFGQTFLPSTVDGEILDETLEALQCEQKLKITYQSAEAEKKATAFTILPLGIVNQASRIYLIARTKVDGSDRLFALPRVLRAKRCEGESFSYPRNFDVQKAADALFKFGSDETIVLKAIMKQSRLVQTLRESPFNHKQKLEDLPDGNALLTVTVQDTWALAWWVLSQAELIEILEPKSYREVTAKRLIEAAANYPEYHPSRSQPPISE